jgi:general secretion pathway protein K
MAIKNEKGVALVLVLVVIALLVSLLVDFTYTMQVDVTLAANQRDEVKALYAARSGVELARLTHFDEHLGFIAEDDEGRFTGMIVDEASKFPINSIVNDQGGLVPSRLEQLERLFVLLDIDPELIDAIADWLDSDDTVGPNGAEDAYYEGLSPPYPCKDGPLASLEELLLVKGMTEEILCGDGAKEGLVHYLTINSDGAVNINTASSVVLQCLSDDIDENLAQAIVDYRQEEPLKDINYDDMKHLPGMTLEIFNEIRDQCAVESSVFSLRVEGQVRGIKKRIFTVLNRDEKAVMPVFWRVE